MAGVRSMEIPTADGGNAGIRIFAYAPGLHQPMHRHERPHLSIVVAGSFIDSGRRNDRILTSGMAIVRADDSRHAVRFGPAGALIASTEMPEKSMQSCDRDGVRLMHAPLTLPRWLECIEDMRPATAGDPPAWIKNLASSLIAAPWESRVHGCAAEYGRDRSDLSRQFRKAIGMPPSMFRHRAMAAHALIRMIFAREQAALAALNAGFYDQSHMSRVVTALFGRPPGALASQLQKSHSSNPI